MMAAAVTENEFMGWERRMRQISLKAVKFVRMEVVDGITFYHFHCNLCNINLRNQHPGKKGANQGVSNHCYGKRHHARFMDILYKHFRKNGGPYMWWIGNPWFMNRYPEALAKAERSLVQRWEEGEDGDEQQKCVIV